MPHRRPIVASLTSDRVHMALLMYMVFFNCVCNYFLHLLEVVYSLEHVLVDCILQGCGYYVY